MHGGAFDSEATITNLNNFTELAVIICDVHVETVACNITVVLKQSFCIGGVQCFDGFSPS